MISKKTLMEEVIKLNINFTLNKTSDELKAWCVLVYDDLSDEPLNDESFKTALKKLRKSTEGNMFNKLPSTGDILKHLDLKPKSIKQMACEQAQLAIQEADRMRFQRFVQFSCPVTNWVVQNAFGGVSQFCWQLDKTNEKRPEMIWVKNKFIDEWITANDRKVENFAPITNLSATFISYEHVLQLGDVSVCESNMKIAIGEKQKTIENKANDVINVATKYLTNK